MATWQQGINSGGLLAGIGAQNENAPRASDINATLGLIRENNELARSGANNVALTGLRGLAGVADIYQQEQQKQRKAAFQKGYADAYASGDREKMRNLVTEFPEEFEEVRKGMGYVDDAQRDDFGNLALRAQVASSLGPGAFGKFMIDNEKEMRRLGVPPEIIADMHVNDPQGFQQFAGNMALFSLGHEKYFDIKDKMEGRNLERRGQDITMRGQTLSHNAMMAQLNHDKFINKKSLAEIQRAGGLNEMDVHTLNSQIASTGFDPLTGKSATGARMGQARKWLEGNDAFNEALITGERGIEKIDKILDQPELDGVGKFSGRMPDIATSEDGLSNRNIIEELKSSAFVQNVQTLRGMGALSNAEGQKLENLIARLDITQPEAVVRKQLAEIREQYAVLQAVAEKESESMGYKSSGYDTYVLERAARRAERQPQGTAKVGQQQTTTGSNFSSLWGD
nr:MAG TPA: DNA/protein translocase of phage P22 injectosome [Caudoviricetes sp.]